jgi:hypothetical protein
MKTTVILFLGLFLAFGTFAASAAAKNSALISTTVVINEVYGGAGCGTAGCSTYQNDFIEIKNISAGFVNISGWSVQYTSATGSAWQVTTIPAGTVLRAGDTYLIAEAFGANGVNPLPTPNATGTIAMSATTGKVALVNNAVALSGTCPTGGTVVDFVGYGTTANCNGSGTNNTLTNAPAPSTTTSDQRNVAGTDTDLDNVDFTAAAPTPQPSLQPTASSVTLDGKVTTSEGRAIPRVTVTLVGGSGEVQTFITSGFGYYTFEGLRSGETYTISVESKSYRFNPSSRTITAMDSVHDLDFTAEP